MCWRPAVPPEQVAAGAEAGPAEPGGVCLDPDETCPCEGSRTQPGPLAASASVERTDSSTRGVSALERTAALGNAASHPSTLTWRASSHLLCGACAGNGSCLFSLVKS